MCNFASDSTSFASGFPGVRPHLLTLTSNFTIPFYREILLSMGVCSVSKRSCERILRKGNGSAITIVVGGAAESLSAHPGTADLTLRRRCALYSILVDAEQTGVFSDWGSSSLQSGKGLSFNFVTQVFHANVDLLVRISYRCFRLARTMYVHLPATKLGAPKIERYQIYQQMPNEKGTTLYTIQKKFQNVFGFTLPLFHGRGILNCE